MTGCIRIAVLGLVLIVMILPVPAMATMYTVESWDALPPGGDAKEPVPLSWWEVPAFTHACYLLCMACPLFCYPAGLLYATGAWWGLGFRRATGSGVLGHPVRSTVYRYIQTHPGIPFAAIARETGINRGTLHYHLYVLLREGLITEQQEGGRTTYFENSGMYSSEEKIILSHLQSGAGGSICLFLSRQRGATRTEIARWMGIAPSSVSWHLSRLSRSGIIAAEKSGRMTIYRLTAGADSLLCTRMPKGTRDARDESSG